MLAHRYWQWSRWEISWSELQAQQRDPELVGIVVPVYGHPAELDGCLQALKQAENSRRCPHCQQRSPLGLTRPPGGPTDDHATAL